MTEEESNAFYTKDITITAPLGQFLALRDIAVETVERWAIEENHESVMADDSRIAADTRPMLASYAKEVIDKIYRSELERFSKFSEGKL